MRITEGEVVFQIYKGILTKMKCINPQKDVTIPHVFPNGEKITTIKSGFCIGKYDTITIEDGITNILGEAFSCAKVKKVHWNKTCKRIPTLCFRFSDIEEIENIDNVENIGSGAFYESDITTFTVPSNCYKIPDSCFANSQLKSIYNTKHLTSIGELAFFKCGLEEFVWPDDCKIIPEACFSRSSLRKITNIQSVEQVDDMAFYQCYIKDIVWPQNCPKIPYKCFSGSSLENFSGFENITSIGMEAFSDVGRITKLDMSKATIAYIGDMAFWDIDEDKIILPYYMEREELKRLCYA